MSSSTRDESTDEWDGSWESNRRRQLLAWLSKTPDQKLQWLESALEFAHAAGVLHSGNEKS